MNLDVDIVKFKLNPNFYSKESILNTLEVFENICSGKFEEKSFEIKLKPKESCDLKELSLEFCNYCLGLMK